MKTLSLALFGFVLFSGCVQENVTKTNLSLIDSDQFADPAVKYSYGDSSWGKYAAKSMYGTNKLVLTFDDGPDPVNTPKLLDILKKYDAKATFFVLGEKLEKNKALVARMIAEGHQVATHDWNHTNNNIESYTTHKTQLEGAIKTIEGIETEYGVYQREMYLRYPYGNYGKGKGGYHHFEVLKELGQKIYGENCLNFVFWDIDTNDWVSSMTTSMIYRNVMSQFDGGEWYARVETKDEKGNTRYSVRKVSKVSNPLRGGVALFHDIHAKTIPAIEMVLKQAAISNIEIVPITEVSEYTYSDALACEMLE